MLLFNVIKAILARALFAIHAFVAVWRVVTIKNGNSSYWLLTTSIGLLVLEGLLSICKRKGREMKWFCPSVFLYLFCIIPPTWIMELDLATNRRDIRMNGNSSIALSRQEKLSQIPGIKLAIDLELSAELWAKILEQFLLVNLVLGRWLLPKGDLTRGQLSQLLLVYIGMAADIVELFEAFKEDAVADNVELTYTVLAMWSWSLMQFSMVLTATKARKTRLGVDSTPKDYCDGDVEKSCWCALKTFCIMDTWAIMTTIIFQDGPFLCLRLLLILRYNVVSYLNVFFTCKNSLVLLLQVYRMTVLNCETREKPPCKRKIVSSDVENYPQKASELEYVENDVGVDCKCANEFGYFPGYEAKMPLLSPTQYSSSDEESRSGLHSDYWLSEDADFAKHRRSKLPEKCKENPLLPNSDIFTDSNRDSVFVAYSQNKGSPWTDVSLNLFSNKSHRDSKNSKLHKTTVDGKVHDKKGTSMQALPTVKEQATASRKVPSSSCKDRPKTYKEKVSKRADKKSRLSLSNNSERNYENLRASANSVTTKYPIKSYCADSRF